jgi:hypothetical protein
MNPRIWTLGALAAVSAGIATAAVADAGSSSPTPPNADDQAYVNARSQDALPGSRGDLAKASHSGYRLTISAPAEDARTQPGNDDRSFSAPPPQTNADVIPLAELGWKAHLVSGVAAARDARITEFSVDWPGISQDQANLLTHRLRTEPGSPLYEFPRLGTVSVGAARKQLASNLDALGAAVPAGVIKRTRVVTVPVDPAQGLFGLEALIRVTDIAALRPYLGDVVDGLATGLVGDDSAVVEGLAINVIDNQGRRAGWWRTQRTGTGFGIPDPSLTGAPMPPVDVDFPNLTGGPPTLHSVSGAQHIAAKRPDYALKADRAIGPLRLGMSRRAVERRLGPSTPATGAVVGYQAAGARVALAYDAKNRLREIRAASKAITAYGKRLSRKRVALKLLRAHGWKVKRCAPYVVAQHFGHGGASGVIWQGKRLYQAAVTSQGGIDICPAESPVR